MAEVAEGLENLTDHMEFEDDKHEVPRRSAKEKHSTEKGFRLLLQQIGLAEKQINAIQKMSSGKMH